MGLDLVELAMAVEERFGITLSDAEAERAETPAQLIEIVMSKVTPAGNAPCRTSHAFYAVRRLLATRFGCRRKDIRPAAALEALVPRPNRRVHWAQMERELAAGEWPGLVRPKWLVAVLSGLLGVLLFVAVARYFQGMSFWLSVALALLVWGAGFLLTRPLCVEFPPGRATVGQLAEFLVGAAPKLFEPAGRRWSRPDVAVVIRDLTIETLGLKPAQYREDANFVRDLGGG